MIDAEKVYFMRTNRMPILSIPLSIEVRVLKGRTAIRWENDGQDGLIPVEKVANAVALRKQKRAAGLLLPPLTFHWGEVTHLGPSDPATNKVHMR